MLVKLGDVWVDPTKVTHLDHSQITPKILIGIINGDTCIASDGNIDDFIKAYLMEFGRK